MEASEYLDALLALPWMVEPRVSRDGRWVAWTWFGAGPAADVYVAPTDGSAGPLRLTDTPENTVLVSWAPDSRSVVVEQDRAGNERTELFQVDLARPLAMLPLTEPEPNHYTRGGELHPNGRWLVYGANVDAASGAEIEPTWIYRHDLETGERVALARPEKATWGAPELNARGTHLLYMRKDLHPAGNQIWLVDVEGREDREVFNFGPDKKVSASWFPDGARALVLAEAETHRRLGVWSLGDAQVRWLLDDPARNIEDAYVPHAQGGQRGGERIVVVEVAGARTRCSLLDPATGEETRLPDLLGNLLLLARAGGGADDWVVQYGSSRQPTDLLRAPLAALASPSVPGELPVGKLTSLARVWERTPLTADDLAPAEDYRWRSVDGLEVQGWLYRPRREARGTVVFVHGGPTSHSTDRVNAEIQFFVREGFVVLDPNYRGSTGFSLAYREAIKEDGWGGREQDDIRAGIEALLAAGIAEPGKVGITGTSYGGYSAWYAITHWPRELVAAAAPVCGMTDLVVDYETTRPDLRPYSEEMMGGSPQQVPERYRERSPLHFVHHVQGRLLIVQGLQDPNVTPENVRAVEGALREAGVPYELLAFEDEGHGILKPKNQRTLYLRLRDFFAEAFAGA